MKIIQTTGGWIASEEMGIFYWRTTIHKESGTIKHICKINNQLTELYSLKLEKEKFSFTYWNKFILTKKSKINNRYRYETSLQEKTRAKHLIWGIRTLRNQNFNKNEYYKHFHVDEELFNLFISGEVDYSSELAQSLYRNPGVKNLNQLLFGYEANVVLEEGWNWEWNHLEAIYNCPWENKAETFQKIGLEYGRYINLFHNPEQFTNNINKIKEYIIHEYLRMELPRIPENLQTAPEIEEYMINQFAKYKEDIPRSIQEIHSLLGDPVEERKRLAHNDFILKTKKVEVNIENILPFPILSLRSRATPETEILLCEELGMRSRNYRPSRLKRYEL